MKATDDFDLRQRRLALAIAITANIGFLVALDRMMPARTQTPHSHPAEILELRLIQSPPAAEPVPSPAPIPSVTAASHSTRSPAPSIPVPTAATIVATPLTLDLFAPDGQVRFPADTPSAPPAVFPAIPRPPAARNPFVHRNPLPHTPGRFDQLWVAPANESLGGAALRKFYAHQWTTPWGTRVSCEQGTATTETPIVIDCRPGSPPMTIEQLKTMRADPPLPKATASGAMNR